jgi:hypothetical protein
LSYTSKNTGAHTMNALTSTANIARLSDTFTSKVTADDIMDTDSKLHDFLVEFATEYVNTYTDTFAFMLNMRSWVNFGLSDAQVAGVVNCALNDYRHAQKRAAVQEATNIVAAPVQARTYDHSKQYVADGYYTVVGPKGGHRTLRLQTIDDNGTKQWLAYLSGADNVGDYKSVGFVNGNEVSLFNKYAGQYADIMAAARFLVRNVDKLDECGRQYAINSGKCYRCNRLLTTPESVARGLGPICSSKQ